MKFPVIIVGAPRSGTSMMASLLRKKIGYLGHHEGHFFDLLHTLLNEVEKKKNEMIPQFKTEKELLLADGTKNIRQDLIDLFKIYIFQAYGDAPWMVKTPSLKGVAALSLIREIYPEARIIFMKRRGIENIISHTKKFSQGKFNKNFCHHWSNCFQEFINNNQLTDYLMIDQLAYIDCPDLVAQKLIDYLNLDNSSSIQSIITNYINVNPVERTSTLTSQYIPIEKTGWSAENKTAFLKICKETMRLGNYPIYQSEVDVFQPDDNFYISTQIKPDFQINHQYTPWNKIPNNMESDFILHPNNIHKTPLDLTFYKQFQPQDFLSFSFNMLNSKLEAEGITVLVDEVDKDIKSVKKLGQLNLRKLDQKGIKVPVPSKGHFLKVTIKNEAGSKNHHLKALKMKITTNH